MYTTSIASVCPSVPLKTNLFPITFRLRSVLPAGIRSSELNGQSSWQLAKRKKLILHSPALDVDSSGLEYDNTGSTLVLCIDFVISSMRYASCRLPEATCRNRRGVVEDVRLSFSWEIPETGITLRRIKKIVNTAILKWRHVKINI